MAIPKEILDVARPKNTVVYCYGKDEIKYGVKKRVGCIRKDGRNLPVNGETVGHIINGRYVPIDEKKKLSSFDYDVRDWANIVFLDRIYSPMMDELLTHYHKDDALKIYCASLLRVAYPGIKNGELKEAYESSFLSIVRPGCALSKNVVSSFLHSLGKSYSLIVAFMRDRVNSCSNDARLLIDGTLKSSESKINSLSDFSRKAIKKGSKDISIVYCYDLEKKEPICSKCYPGNMLDVTAYSNFIEENGVTKGMIIADKGFPSSAASSHFENNPNLHYLNPIKRNSKLIERHSMFSFEGVLTSDSNIQYKKAKVNGTNKYLYAFRDAEKAAMEETDYLKRTSKEGIYNHEEYLVHRNSFGTIVFECDLSWPPEDVYFAYSKRWEIEIVMRYYKQSLELDETRVHGDLSVIGSEFIDFLATVLTFKVLSYLDNKKILEEMSYGKFMKQLVRAKKVKILDKWSLVKINPSIEETLRTIEVLPRLVEKEKRPRGRPRKVSI